MAGLNPLYPAPDKWRPGDNLLDNWYFVGGGSQLGGGQFPINQRGQTEYTAVGYGIDRWFMYRDTKITINGQDNCIDVSADSIGVEFGQYIENFADYAGKTLTFSVLYNLPVTDNRMVIIIECGNSSHGIVLGQTGIDAWELATTTLKVSDAPTYLRCKLDEIVSNQAVAIRLKAAKLELGDHQTLAHKEGGKWVLNRVPDFREEMAKCRAYYRKGYKTFAVATSASFAFTEMEYNMRAVPLALLSILDKDNNPINAVLHEATANGCNILYSAASEFAAGETSRIEAELNANL